MNRIIVKNQAEFDAIQDDFQGIIEIRNDRQNVIYINRRFRNSSVVARGNSSVVARENSSAKLCGWSQARIMSRYAQYELLHKARVILPFQGIGDYVEYFGIEERDGKLVLYKSVHSEGNGAYHSDHNHYFKYRVGETSTEEKIDMDIQEDCGRGIHVSHMSWALNFGRSWPDLAIIECEVSKDKCVAHEFTDGKIRTSAVKVIREVPREEWGIYGKIIKERAK